MIFENESEELRKRILFNRIWNVLFTNFMFLLIENITNFQNLLLSNEF